MRDYFKHVKFQHILAILVVVLCFAFLFYMVSSKFPADKIPMASDIKMGMLTLLTAIVMYYFGSSMSSIKKDEAVNKIIDQTTKKEENAKD